MIGLLKRIGAPLAVLVLAVNLAGCGVNTIPTQEERARAAWSEVLNQYQRRNDLIPNLVETVKGYAEQERDVFIQVTEARAKATQIKIDPSILTDPAACKRFEEVHAQLSGAPARLLAVSERYPDLKSSQNFLTLQAQLEGTENRVAVARRDYIEALRAYNTELKTFPGIIWANVLYRNNKPMETFTIDQPAMRPPTVNFDKK